MDPAERTRIWRENLRNQLGDPGYLARQRDIKRVYRARRRAEQGQEPAQARNGVRCECKCEGQPQPQPQPQPQAPPRPATRPSTETIRQIISKSKAPPPVPAKITPVKKLQLLLKQLNIQKNNKND